MANKSKWTMTDSQKAFVEAVAAYENGVTLFELKLAGKEFASGAVNTLTSKGVLVKDGTREFECDVVFNGVVVGKAKKTGVVFKVAKAD